MGPGCSLLASAPLQGPLSGPTLCVEDSCLTCDDDWPPNPPYLFGHRVSCSPGWPGTFVGPEDDFELLTRLPQPPKCCDYRHVPPHLVSMVLGMGPGALSMLARVLPNELHPPNICAFVLDPWDLNEHRASCVSLEWCTPLILGLQRLAEARGWCIWSWSCCSGLRSMARTS